MSAHALEIFSQKRRFTNDPTIKVMKKEHRKNCKFQLLDELKYKTYKIYKISQYRIPQSNYSVTI